MKFQWLVLAASLSIGIIWYTVQFSYGRLLVNIQESFPGASLATLMSGVALNTLIYVGLSPVALFVIRLLKYKNTLLVGAGTSTVGIYLISMAMNEYQFLVGYGTYAVGGLFIYNASTFIIGQVFPQKSRYHVLATSLNRVIVPICFITAYISNSLVLLYGWRITYVIFGVISLVILIISAYIYGLQEEMDSRDEAGENHHPIFDLIPEEPTESFFEWIKKSKLKRIALMLSFILAISSKAMFINCVAYILVKHGVTLGFSETDSSKLVLYGGLSDLFSRLATSLIADRFLRGNLVKMYIVSLLMGSAVQFSGYFARNYNELVIYVLTVGLFLGPLVTGCYAMCGEIVPVRFINDLYAYYFTSYGIGQLFGLVMDGYIYDITGSFYGVFIMNGCLHIFSALMYGVLIYI